MKATGRLAREPWHLVARLGSFYRSRRLLIFFFLLLQVILASIVLVAVGAVSPPGVPPIGTAERSLFSLSFWSALYSGAIYSIITGLIVGVVVDRSLRVIDERSRREQREREYRRSMRALMRGLRPLLTKDDVFNVGWAQDALPPGTREAIELLQASSIDEWAEEMPSFAPALRAFDNLLAAFELFKAAAEKLDLELRQFARRYLAYDSELLLTDFTLVSYLLLRLSGEGKEVALTWSGIIPGKASLSESAFDALSRNPEIHLLVVTFLDARLVLRQTMISVASLIESERPEQLAKGETGS